MKPLLADIPTSQILTEIAKQQAIQKTHPTTSAKWMAASNVLAPLFREMARREPS
jgi:hypothetical protein